MRQKMADTEQVPVERHSKRHARKCEALGSILVKEELKSRFKQVSKILQIDESNRSDDDNNVLQQSPDIVDAICKRAKLRNNAKQRSLEIEDSADVLHEKCRQLAAIIKKSKNIVIYTGAGISTAASIPDYRGPNGVWTLLQKGKELQAQELSDSEPTLTHMSIAALSREDHVVHVVSQNCDGLHIRSGLARQALSEVHGNMYIELCSNCKISREYVRLFDVTERTGVRRHVTGRLCHKCHSNLRDTIVHFGEKGGLKSPYRWKEAVDAVNKTDMILCLGSSLKVLKKYACLWSMDKKRLNRPPLYIINLQWTPKDDGATMKINAKCDDVMEFIMDELGIPVPVYQREKDPLFSLATVLQSNELDTTTKKVIPIPPNLEIPTKRKSVKHSTYRRIDHTLERKYGVMSKLLKKPVKWKATCSGSFGLDNVVPVVALKDCMSPSVNGSQCSKHGNETCMCTSGDIDTVETASIETKYQETDALSVFRDHCYQRVISGKLIDNCSIIDKSAGGLNCTDNINETEPPISNAQTKVEAQVFVKRELTVTENSNDANPQVSDNAQIPVGMPKSGISTGEASESTSKDNVPSQETQKRKIVTSVPGWFGKGMNYRGRNSRKKKRKF